MSNICSAINNLNPDEVMQETWGHLDPKHNTTYSGTIDVACDGGSEYLVTDWRLMSKDGEFVCSGPTFYEHSNDFACEVIHDKEAGFYSFTIEYTRDGPHGYHIKINDREKIG